METNMTDLMTYLARRSSNAPSMTEEEIDATERIRPLLLDLGNAIMKRCDTATVHEARKALEASGAILSAHDDPSKVMAFGSPDDLMICAHYGRCRLPIVFAIEEKALWAAKFPSYEEVIQSQAEH